MATSRARRPKSKKRCPYFSRAYGGQCEDTAKHEGRCVSLGDGFAGGYVPETMRQTEARKRHELKEELKRQELIARAEKAYNRLGPFWKAELKRGNVGWYNPLVHLRTLATYELKELVAGKRNAALWGMKYGG